MLCNMGCCLIFRILTCFNIQIYRSLSAWWSSIEQICLVQSKVSSVKRTPFKALSTYSRVHKSSDSFFSKILEKPSIVQKEMMPHIKGLDFSQRWRKKKFKMADLENSKWPPQKNLIFQLRQFSIFFHENFMDWSLGW